MLPRLQWGTHCVIVHGMIACGKETQRCFRLKLLYSALTAPSGDTMGFLVMNTRLVLSDIFRHYTRTLYMSVLATFFSVNSYYKSRLYKGLQIRIVLYHKKFRGEVFSSFRIMIIHVLFGVNSFFRVSYSRYHAIHNPLAFSCMWFPTACFLCKNR